MSAGDIASSVVRPCRICVVTFPVEKSGIVPLSGIIRILHALSSDLYLITGNEAYDFFKNDPRMITFGVQHKSGANVATRTLKYIYAQLRLAYVLLRIISKADVFVFTFGGEASPLLMGIVKLFRKKAICRIASSLSITSAARKEIFSGVWRILEILCLRLADRVTVSSYSLIDQLALAKYKAKVMVTVDNLVDLDHFKIEKPIQERNKVVAFVGRLIAEKGIMNFVYSIPAIVGRDSDINMLIIGDGPLLHEIEQYLAKENLGPHTKLVGWIPNDRLPEYLNQARLLVVPSFTETGPLIALEAMACGTPVLATRVGYIPDIVRDGETGFILGDNSPDSIAENALKAILHPKLEQIALNARMVAEATASYEKSVSQYAAVIRDLVGRR
jgi:glycosyltransferase involved in cell wall biosynthesis